MLKFHKLLQNSIAMIFFPALQNDSYFKTYSTLYFYHRVERKTEYMMGLILQKKNVNCEHSEINIITLIFQLQYK